MASAMGDLCKTAELAENTLAVFLKTQNLEPGTARLGLTRHCPQGSLSYSCQFVKFVVKFRMRCSRFVIINVRERQSRRCIHHRWIS